MSVGSVEPRLWTKPLRPLTPETSYGFDVIEFARDVLHRPLDPWQEWTVIHLGELLEDGRPRFKKYLILVARQNGKTELLVVLALYWMYVVRVAMVLGTSTKLDYAAESLRKAYKLAKRVPELSAEIPRNGGWRKANGEQVLWRADSEEVELEEGSRYKVAASNEEGGRSLTVDRLILDELRQHHDYSAWDASEGATQAVYDAQIVMISNAGSDKSVVLNDTRTEALHFIKTGEGDPRLGIAEYSAPDGASPIDSAALAQANPNAGHRILMEDLVNEGAAAMRVGGKKLAGFRTEKMCQHVPNLDLAVDMDAWLREHNEAWLLPEFIRTPNVEPGCLDPGSMRELRNKTALVFEVDEDEQHATLYAAAELDDGRIRVDVVKAWAGPNCTKQMRDDLPGEVKKVRPRAVGWFPNGPTAAVVAGMGKRPATKNQPAWPPTGVQLTPIAKDQPAVCMGMANLIANGGIAHSSDALLDAQLSTTEKQHSGDTWRFVRRGGHVDAVYAAAGAIHLARTLPPPAKPRLRSLG